MTSAPGDAADRLRRALAGSAVPVAVHSARRGTPPDPEPGQLWRARWETVTALVVVLAVSADVVEAAPVTVDPDYADDAGVIVPGGDNPLGVDAVVWMGLRRRLPMAVLDRFLGPWPATGSAGLNGWPVVSPADPRSEYRARLEDEVDELAAAHWTPQGAGTLGQVLHEANVNAGQLVELLDVAPQDALALLRGQQPVTAEQAATLATAVGVTVEDILAANPELPAGVVTRLDRPRRREQVDALAARRGLSEVAARQAAAFGAWRLAARRIGDREDPAWDARLDRYFDAVLDE